METKPTYKVYPNVFADGNASIHLGDVICVSGEGNQGERIALNQIIARLDRIINSNGSIHQADGSRSLDFLKADCQSSHPSMGVGTSVMTPMSNPLDKNYPYHSQFSNDLLHLPKMIQQERTSDRDEGWSMTCLSSGSKLRSQRHAELKAYLKELSIGKLIVRIHLRHGSMGPRDGPTAHQAYQLSAHFIPKPWFYRKVIRLRMAWSVFGQEISGISINPSFADIVPDNHPMIHCAATGDVSGLKALLMLENGPRPSCTTSAGWSPLHFAAAAGHYEVCQLLLSNGASPNAAGDSNINPLHVSAHFGKLRVFRRLLIAGGDIDDLHDHGTNPLFDLLANQSLIISEEFHDFIHWLIRGQECHLVDTETTDNRGQSILFHLVETLHAISDGRADSSLAKMYAESIHALVPFGVDLNARNVYGDALLHIACRYRQIDIVHMLLKNGCEIDVRDANDYTPLHRAVEREDCEVASILIQRGAEIEAIAHPGDMLPSYHTMLGYVTPLSLVAVNGNTEMFAIIRDQLLRTGEDKNLDEVYWTEILHIAASCSNYELMQRLTAINPSKAALSNILGTTLDVRMIEILVLAGASPDGSMTNTSRWIWEPLTCAARDNDLDAVKKLLELGADVNRIGCEGRCALHYAAAYGNLEMADMLLSYGADREVHNAEGLSPTEEAISSGFTELALKISAEPIQLRTSDLSLTRACQTNNVDIAKRLVADGASMEDGELELAINWSSFEVAEFLINAGARVHRGYSQRTGQMREDVPLLEAASRSDRIVRLLIERGANVNEILDENETPLLHVLDRFWCDESLKTRTKIARTLLEAGAKVSVKDVFGRTPLGKAAQIGALEIAQLLIDGGADVDEMCTMNISQPPYKDRVRCIPPRTPLAWAARNGDTDMVKLLYEAGAQWKSLKKDPAVSHVHGFLMKSWFIDSVRSITSGQDDFSLVTGSLQSGIPESGGERTTSQRASEGPVRKIIPTRNHPWWPGKASSSQQKLLWFVEVMLMRPAKLVYATMLHIVLELSVIISIVSLVTIRWVGQQISRIKV